MDNITSLLLYMGFAISASLSLMGAGGLCAEEFLPSTTRPESAFENVKIDLLGVSPSMTADQVATAIKNQFHQKSRLNVSTAKFPGSNEAFIVSQAINEINVRKGINEDFQVFFTSPASMKKIWFIYRNVSYSDEARPDLDGTVKAIFEKYGTPTAMSGMSLYWFYRGGSVVMGKDAITAEIYKAQMDRPGLVPMPDGIDVTICSNVTRNLNPRSQVVNLVHHHARTRHTDCSGYFQISLGSDGYRIHGLTAKIVDYPLVKSASVIDDEAIRQAEAFVVRTAPSAPPPRL